MKKFINEYKALRVSKSDTGSSKNRNKVDSPDSPPDMGVFKWLRRERVTVTTHSVTSDAIPQQEQHSQSATQIGTIRTEEYKRDLAEFQARRSTGNKDTPELPDTPVKKKCGRHSLPCTDCTTVNDNTFNYEKKSTAKHKKKTHKRTRSATADERIHDPVPNIQFLFQNQVFMPGNLCPAYSEPRKSRRQSRRSNRSPEFNAQKHIDFNEDQLPSPPLFYRNNSLPFDVKNFLDGSKSDVEEVDGKVSSHSSGEGLNKRNASDEKLWEVMSELRNFDQWADEQLQGQSSTKSDDSKSDSSAYGLPIASAVNLDMNCDRNKVWNQGKWGMVRVQMKKLTGVSVDTVKKKLNTEINILRKFRHPNIILLMGLYPDVQNNIHIICEQCIDSLYGILHVQGSIPSAQSSVHYTLDIANALVFLRMQGYIHTELTSHSVMITSHDAAKLADLGPCVKLPREKLDTPKGYDLYSPEPQYVNLNNIQETRESATESDPLISKHSSETYLATNSVSKSYETYRRSELYRWQAPELFEPDDGGAVHPCSKSDVYSLCLVLWESCNATVPWNTHTYVKLKEQYMLWNTGIPLPKDGTYPGGLLALLQSGLKLSRSERIDLTTLHSTLYNVKNKLDDLECIIIPARLTKKQSNFSSIGWETNSPTDESECLSPLSRNIQHKAVVHTNKDTSDSSEKETKSDVSPMYDTIRKDKIKNYSLPQKCYVSDDELPEDRPVLAYQLISEKEPSSACSTPIAKIKARIHDVGTPNALHRSDSTEYCSFFSPENRHFTINDDSNKDERPTAKLSRSFTPKSYKPLHIKVPDFNLDGVKSILKETSGSERSSYNFDIKNYSLPSTPIARSNKLRKNAWLSGDLHAVKSSEKLKDVKTPNNAESIHPQSAPETPAASNTSSLEKEHSFNSKQSHRIEEKSPDSECLDRDSITGLRRVDPPHDFSPEAECTRERTNSWTYKTSERPKSLIEEDVLAGVNVKPLVAIHERWIYEANRKTGRSMSLPEDNRNNIAAVKPASHCVDTLQKSLPQLNTCKKSNMKTFRARPGSPAASAKSGSHWEQFCQARDTVAKSMNFAARDPERFLTWRRDTEKGTTTEETRTEPKVDQATDTRSIEEFIRDLIRKEFQHLMHEVSDDISVSTAPKSEEILSKGVANIMENLKNGEADKKEFKSFSRVKINGNNKPLLQITFTRSGENSLQVLDNCVNVTICDSPTGRDKFNVSMEDTLTSDDVQVHSLKRCQAFNAIQEARSTEDLYIDDELAAQAEALAAGGGGAVGAGAGGEGPLQRAGELHTLLCDRDDDCCLLRLQRENGCDTLYFRYENSDTESRDAIDGHATRPNDTVLYKRSFSLVEERIQRVLPRDKRTQTPVVRRTSQSVETNIKARPKSEVFHNPAPNINEQSRVLSASSPSLMMNRNDEVEVNLEHAMSYQDSSSEECVRCQADHDDFELLEQKIEEDLAHSNLSSLTCGCLEKISEENLSAFEETVDRE